MMTGASPSVGSSSNNSRAPVRRVRPIASICCSPPESLVPWLEPRRSFRLGNKSKMRSSVSPPGLTTGGSNRFSSTLRLAHTPRSSGPSATPARAIGSEVRAISSSLLNSTDPVRLPTIPMIDFRVVVLPAPLRPSRVTTSPSRTSKITPWRMWDSPYQACRSFTARSGVLGSSMTNPHVSLTHFRIVRDCVVVAFCQDSSARQYGNVMGKIGHDGQIVLDHQNGAIGRYAFDQLRHAINVLVTHTCSWFVKQQHLRIERQRGGNLQRPLAAIRKFDCQPVGDRRQTDIGDQLPRPII